MKPSGHPLLRIKAADMRCLVECLEQRDALGSSNEYSDAVWFQTRYKPFAGAKSARSSIDGKENQYVEKKES